MEHAAVMSLPSSPASRTAYRGLSPDLHAVEERLTLWGQWTRTREDGGWPTRSVHTKAKEGGITAGSPRPPTTLPEEVAEVDRIIAKMRPDWQCAARVNWQYGELPREKRAMKADMPLAVFRRRVDAIRISVRAQLRI